MNETPIYQKPLCYDSDARDVRDGEQPKIINLRVRSLFTIPLFETIGLFILIFETFETPLFMVLSSENCKNNEHKREKESIVLGCICSNIWLLYRLNKRMRSLSYSWPDENVTWKGGGKK